MLQTNHSLRATTTTRLYSKGVDEQLVMECTGYHSIEGIQSYKWTSSEQQENISDILNGKKPYLDAGPTTNMQPLVPTSSNPPSVSFVSLAPSPVASSAPPCSQLTNISAPHHSSTDNVGAFYLSSCSNISINFHYSKT